MWQRRRRWIERVTGAFCDRDLLWRAAFGVVPWHTELAFGFDPVEGEVIAGDDDVGDGTAAVATPALVLTLPRGGEVRFRGRIDRIDRAPDGSTLVVTDYKSGSAPDYGNGSVTDPVAAGRQLQLGIYGMVAERLEPDAEVDAYYRYVAATEDRPGVPVASFAVTRRRVHDVVQGIVDGVEHGVFPADPGRARYEPWNRRDTFDNCRYCDFDMLCPTDRGEAFARKHDDPQLAPRRALAVTQEEIDELIEEIDGAASLDDEQ
jgi:hypothetical protein